MLRACFTPLFALLLLLLAPLSQAELNPAVALAHLHAARLSVHATESAFHRYQESEGDKKQLVILNSALQQLKGNFQAAYQDLADLGLTAELNQVQGHWRSAARDLNAVMTAIAGGGYAEGAITNSYLLNSYLAAQDLKAAQDAVVRKTGIKVSPTLQTLRDAGALFQEMAALYMERSSTQYGYTYRSEAGNNDTLDMMAARFSQMLGRLEQPLASNPEAAKRLANVRKKWGFLEKSFINYNENSVPYLVVKFGGEIVTGLDELATQYDQP